MPMNWSMRASAWRRGRLQRRAGEGAVDIAGDGAGFVEHEAVMDQGRHAAEGMQRQIGRPGCRGEGVHLDPVVGHPLLGQGEAGDAEIDAVAIAVQDQGHGAILASR